MSAPNTTSSQQSTTTQQPTQRFSAVRMPIEEPVEDFADAVEKLQRCSSTELRRARQHHRRALESLRQGGYSALSDNTREDLIAQLRSNLRALNQALETTASTNEHADDRTETQPSGNSFSSRFRTLFQGLW